SRPKGTMSNYRYPWPASAVGPEEMAMLYLARESSQEGRATITELLAEAARAQYGHLADQSQLTTQPQRRFNAPPKKLTQKNVFRKLQQLDLPTKTKTLLRELYESAADLVRRIVSFLYANRVFATYLALGICLYVCLGPIPVIGKLLASLGLTFGMLYGLFRKLEFDVQRQFAVLVAQPA
ncbi:MAG TPA: hypothetical protein PLZ95_10645, partial [Bryobacteraceae bacterium]|nr:hypothetical protein [Bryobacteraceae bacterium]